MTENDKVIVTKSKINSIVNAIHYKNNESDGYTLDQMPAKIKAISSGSGEGGVGATITVTTTNEILYGQNVTLTDGVNTMIAKLSNQGIATFEGVEMEGQLTISVTYQGDTYETSVGVATHYEVCLDYAPISTLTWSQIGDIINRHYTNGLDLTKFWSVGDTLSLNIGSMPAAYDLDSAHDPETVELVILDFDHDNLTEPIGEIQKAAVTFGMIDVYSQGGAINNTRTNAGGWGDSLRRQWCNDTFFNALPTDLKPLIKSVTKTACTQPNVTGSTEDKVCIPSMKEVVGHNGTWGEDGGEQYSYYVTHSAIKRSNGSPVQYFCRNIDGGSNGGTRDLCFGGITAEGIRQDDPPYANSGYPNTFMFCV